MMHIFTFLYTKKGQVYGLFLNSSRSAVLLLQRDINTNVNIH